MSFTYRNILQIVVPLIISGFGQSIIYVTDILFLGRLGEIALGASAIAGLFYASIMMVGFGISSGLQVLIAQKVGEGKSSETHRLLLNGILLQILISIVITLLYFLFRSFVIYLFVKNIQVGEATEQFLNIRILGLFPYFIFYAYRSYYLGIGSTKIISAVTIVMSILNLILNPILIHGWQFIQPMNYLGSATASVISEYISTFIIMLYYAYSKKSAKFISHIEKLVLKNIIQTSLPLIFQHFISVFSWFLFFVFIEKMGTKELATSNVIRAVYVLVMAPILAFSHSTITIIGQLFGGRAYLSMNNTLWKIIYLSIIFTLPFSCLSFFKPEWLMMIFTDNVEIIHHGRNLMRLVAFALMYFAFSMPWLSAVTGIGETNKALVIESLSFIIYILASYLFVFVLKWDLLKVWLNEFVYFTSIFVFSKWFYAEKMKSVLKEKD